MSHAFEKKVAVITGGGGVLCSTMARALAHKGAQVAILYLKQVNAESVAGEIVTVEGKANRFACNVSDPRSLEVAHETVSGRLGRCDILINGAGGNLSKGTTSNSFLLEDDLYANKDLKSRFDLDPEGIRFVFDLNFVGSRLEGFPMSANWTCSLEHTMKKRSG